VPRVCKYTPNREDRFCTRHKYLETKWLQERLDVCAEKLKFPCHPCELCNERDHSIPQCKLFHDRIMSKNCDDLISLAHHNELSLLVGYEEMKRITKDHPELVLDKVLDFDLEELFFVLCGELHWKSLYCQLHKEKKKNRRWREY